MDTAVMEYTAEDLIAHKLQRAGILIAKPKFDQKGADLLGLLKVADGANFCRIQCKGRSVINSSSSIKIRKDYVKDAFVVFLYVEDGQEEKTHLFAFFKDDIETWSNNETEYTLTIKQSTFPEDLKDHIYSQKTIQRIKAIINSADMNIEWALVAPQAQEVNVQKNGAGILETTIVDKITGVYSAGSPCPGNPDKYEYDPIADVWSAK